MRHFLVGLLLFAGCVVGDTNDPETDGTTTGEQPSIGALSGAEDVVQGPEPSVCDVLPCDGPCSLACDRDALIEQYVPKGFCIHFFCELTDGRLIVLDACRPPDEE